jgi:hypothetical protein
MFKFLTLLLSLLDRLFGEWDKSKLRQEGRQDAQEQLDANVEKAEAAVATPDPERDERLRARFDRSRNQG